MNQIITTRPVGFGDLTSALQAAPALSTAANTLQASFTTSPPSCNSNSLVKAFQAQFNSTVAAAGLSGAVRTDGLYDTATQTALQSVLAISSTGSTAPAAATCSSAAQSLAAAEGMFGGGTTGMVVLSAIAIAVVGGIGYGIYRMEHKSSGRRRNPIKKRTGAKLYVVDPDTGAHVTKYSPMAVKRACRNHCYQVGYDASTIRKLERWMNIEPGSKESLVTARKS